MSDKVTPEYLDDLTPRATEPTVPADYFHELKDALIAEIRHQWEEIERLRWLVSKLAESLRLERGALNEL